MQDNWQQLLKRMHLDDIKAKAPNFFEMSGGYSMQVKPYTDRTANGLTRCIIDFLSYSGHYANRINTQGQARVQNIPRYNLFSGKVEHTQRVKYTKSTTRRGTADLTAILNGLAVHIEVKVGADTMSEHQEKEQRKILAAGGLYLVATSMPQFLQWYQSTFIQNQKV